MENIYIQETWIDQKNKSIIGETDIYETFTDSKGKLFKALQNEYGRCVSKIFIDDLDGKTKQVGWVFEKKQKYDDVNEFFILETWITIKGGN
jgi:hypothetical protein